MKGLFVAIVLIVSFLLLLVLAACRVSAEADAQAEEAFQRMLERHSRSGDAVLHEEAVMDAGKE